MKNKLVRFLALLAIFIFCLTPVFIFAEEFKVIQSLSGLDNLSRVLENDDISVDLSGLSSEEDKAKKVSETALKKEIRGGEEESSEIILLLKEIQEKNSAWYLIYIWQYESEFKRKNKLDRLLKTKIDFKNNVIIYEKDMEGYYTTGTE